METQKHRHRERSRQREDRCRNWNTAGTSQGIARIAEGYQKVGRGKKGFFRGSFAKIMISDFWPTKI